MHAKQAATGRYRYCGTYVLLLLTCAVLIVRVLVPYRYNTHPTNNEI